MKNYFILSLVTYAMGIAVCFCIDIDTSFSKSDTEKIETFYSGFKQEKKTQVLSHIIKNNLNVLLINFIGIFSFGVLSFINTAYNGFTLTYILRSASSAYSSEQLLNNILPHSIELIGLLISTAISFYCGVHFFKFCFIKTQPKKFKLNQIIYLAIVSVFITIIAGFFEVYVSLA
ncbi:Stage II sporulation protein M [Pedobacter suwonensis]|uniref:Stage II sporulation protein M n=1 Tax=Pedobacter suwonensis TaxID=332999 RepID=A0A1I0SXF7_9SPHI|nr:stage II sporulation protein M [Pedobacter suwonensis]SFA44189.1 Stage II sporulation protein M [Pedobacter suwonensis]